MTPLLLPQVMYVVTIFPYIMMTILLINGATLDGAADGIEYYLNPDFDRLSDGTVSASGHAPWVRWGGSRSLWDKGL